MELNASIVYYSVGNCARRDTEFSSYNRSNILSPDRWRSHFKMATAGFTAIIDHGRPDLSPYEALYRDLHEHPELSLQEERTSAIAVKHLKALSDFEVHERIGGYGLAAVLRNGAGKTILLRADMDALPVREETGLDYASKATMTDGEDGVMKPVMHACGYDMHVACLLAAAETLHNTRDRWKGTLIALFQPNEERAGGAQAMVDDGLYQKVPKPDIALGQHVMPYRAGTVGTKRGLMASAADSFKITVYGRGGHASQPHRTIDPVLLAAQIVVRLQGIVSREVAPGDAAVVTVGSIQAGMTENIIPDSAVIRVNVRTVKPETRLIILTAIKRIIKAECDASNATKDPLVEPTSRFPFTVNDDNVTRSLEKSFADHFGANYSPNAERLQGSEDFPILATSAGVPYCYWTFGGTDPLKWDEAEKDGRLLEDIPINHSPKFAPVIQPTLATGVNALVLATLVLLHD